MYIKAIETADVRPPNEGSQARLVLVSSLPSLSRRTPPLIGYLKVAGEHANVCSWSMYMP